MKKIVVIVAFVVACCLSATSFAGDLASKALFGDTVGSYYDSMVAGVTTDTATWPLISVERDYPGADYLWLSAYVYGVDTTLSNDTLWIKVLKTSHPLWDKSTLDSIGIALNGQTDTLAKITTRWAADSSTNLGNYLQFLAYFRFDMDSTAAADSAIVGNTYEFNVIPIVEVK